jgi:hypothetical protein
MATKQRRKMIEGTRIRRIRWMKKEEVEAEGWDSSMLFHYPIPLIELDNGVKIYPSQDNEGNGGGAFFGTLPGGEKVHVVPDTKGSVS